MGKALIIKGADFSANAVDTITELYEDITDKFIQGFMSPQNNGNGKIYNSSYNSGSSLIPKFLVLMEDSTTLYDTRDRGVEIFVPSTLALQPILYKHDSTIDQDGIISPSLQKLDKFEGVGRWINMSDVIELLQPTNTYDCFSGNIVKHPTSEPMTLAQAKEYGLKARRLKSL